MLPSKGYFNSINCPCYESNTCNRPHCHFRHVKKDKKNEAEGSKPLTDKVNGTSDDKNGMLLEHLVTAAVEEVLSHSDVRDKRERDKLDTNTIVNDVVNKLQPSVENKESPGNNTAANLQISYKPTPIAELKKRHIPVMYAPEKPASTMRKDFRNNNADKFRYVPVMSNVVKNVSRYANKVNTKMEYSPDGVVRDDSTYVPSKIEDGKVNEEINNYTPSGSSMSNLEYTPSSEKFLNSYSPQRSTTSPSKETAIKSSTKTNTKPKIESSVKLVDNSCQDNNVNKLQNGVCTKDNKVDVTPLQGEEIEKLSLNESSKKHKNGVDKQSKSKLSDTKKEKVSKSHSSHHSHHKSHKRTKRKHHEDKMEREHSSKKSSSHKRSSHSKCKDTPKTSERKSRNSTKHSSHSTGKKRKLECDLPAPPLSASPDCLDVTPAAETIIIDSSPERDSLEKEMNQPCNICNEPAVGMGTFTCEGCRESGNLLDEPEEPSPQAKKRIAHGLSSIQSQTSHVKLTNISPTKALCERWLKARQTLQKPSTLSQGKIRISSVPNVTSLLDARNKIKMSTAAKSSEKVDAVAFLKKPAARVAHVPIQGSTSSHPFVEPDDDNKIPLVIRQACLTSMYEEYLKFVDPDTANQRAVSEEKEIAKRIKNTKTYQNSMALAVLRIRKTCGISGEENSTAEKLRSNSIPKFTYGLTLYECFQKYLMTEDELKENGYPFEIKGKTGYAQIKAIQMWRKPKQPDDPLLRICAHCSMCYSVTDDGTPITEYDCNYHWGRAYKTKVGGSWTSKYRCCESEVGSEPCTTGKYHVSDIYDDECLPGFVVTSAHSSNKSACEAGIYALDCEMCYTTHGVELTRCTMVDLNGNLCLDLLVKPKHKILDYCTRFSGVNEDSLKNIITSLQDIQKELLTMISEKTILIGHSLENDLKALRIVHKTVIDTSLVFPHRSGPPMKRSLKHVVTETLHKEIQNQASGHDSREDAIACLDLMMWKIKQDAKSRKPRVILSLDKKH